MSQQLNLLHPGLRQPRQWSATQALLCLAVVLLVSVLAAASLQWHSQVLVAQGHTVHAVLTARQAQLQALRSGALPVPKPTQGAVPSASAPLDLSPPQDPTQLEREVQHLRLQLAAQQQLRHVLDTGSAGRLEGYSAHLLALARQARGQVWITGLRLDGNGAPVELEGRLRDPAALPDYLQHLSTEKEFQGRNFAQLQLRRVAAGNEGMTALGQLSEFSLRSQIGPALPPPAALPTPAPAATAAPATPPPPVTPAVPVPVSPGLAHTTP